MLLHKKKRVFTDVIKDPDKGKITLDYPDRP